MPELKTRKTKASVSAFLTAIADPRARKDCRELVKLMRAVTGSPPVMWGPYIVGFGSCRYRNTTGTNEWFLAGFSPRKQSLSLYLMGGIHGYATLLRRLGRHKTGKGCLYVRTLDDVDRDVLRELVESSVARARSLWPGT